MSLSMGCFVENYRSQSIFWAGSYNLDGSGDYRTIGEARAAVDRMWEQRSQQEEADKRSKLDSGAIRCERAGDSVTVYIPDGRPLILSLRQFRQQVFEIEEKYGRDTVIV